MIDGGVLSGVREAEPALKDLSKKVVSRGVWSQPDGSSGRWKEGGVLVCRELFEQ